MTTTEFQYRESAEKLFNHLNSESGWNASSTENGELFFRSFDSELNHPTVTITKIDKLGFVTQKELFVGSYKEIENIKSLNLDGIYVMPKSWWHKEQIFMDGELMKIFIKVIEEKMEERNEIEKEKEKLKQAEIDKILNKLGITSDEYKLLRQI